jgi:hypothetical protein
MSLSLFIVERYESLTKDYPTGTTTKQSPNTASMQAVSKITMPMQSHRGEGAGRADHI